jgi:hypothetical protein
VLTPLRGIDVENQIRGLLKVFGLIIGRAKMKTFTSRIVELIDGQPALAAAVNSDGAANVSAQT